MVAKNGAGYDEWFKMPGERGCFKGKNRAFI
jgi:hypothetical protein